MLTELIHNIPLAYWRNTLAYNIFHRVKNIWLVLFANISGKLFTINDQFTIPTFFVDER